MFLIRTQQNTASVAFTHAHFSAVLWRILYQAPEVVPSTVTFDGQPSFCYILLTLPYNGSARAQELPGEPSMPDFAKAEVSNETTDLTPYRTFLKHLEVGQAVTLPLEQGETTRKVMRALNLAAGYNSMRLARLPSDNGAVRFRVLSPAKRKMNISKETKQARVEKSRATRAARRAEESQPEAMEMPAAGEASATSESGSTRPRRRRP